MHPILPNTQVVGHVLASDNAHTSSKTLKGEALRVQDTNKCRSVLAVQQQNTQCFVHTFQLVQVQCLTLNSNSKQLMS